MFGLKREPVACRFPENVPRDDAWWNSELAHGVAYKSKRHSYRHWDFHSRCTDRVNLTASVQGSGTDQRLVVGGCASKDILFCIGCDGNRAPPKNAIKYDPLKPPAVASSERVVQVWCRRKLAERSDGVTWGIDDNFLWRTVLREPTVFGKSPHVGSSSSGGDTPVKIVLLILDSVSNLHFARSMPQFNATVRRLFQQQGTRTFDFDMLHVVGWNSNENQVPMLAGAYWRHIKGPSSRDLHCNSLWSAFRNEGFVTAHAEHGYWFPVKKYFENQRKFCKKHGTESQRDQEPDITLEEQYWVDEKWGCARTVESLTDYLASLVGVHRDTRLFASSYIPDSHSNFGPRYLQTMDAPLAKFYSAVASRNDTIVVMIADHGLHFGPHLESFEGQVEHKLPVMKVTVPAAVLEKRPRLAQMLEVNSRRLVSHYDVHLSLAHLAKSFGKDPATPLPPVGNSVALSFVGGEVPYNRTCEEAGIDESICMCSAWEKVSGGEKIARQIADGVATFLNKQTSARTGCQPIAVQRVLSYARKAFKRLSKPAGELAKVQFTVHPRGSSFLGQSEGGHAATFEAVVYLRGTGGYDWQPELTGEQDIHHIHRVTPMEEWEKEAMRGSLSAAEAKQQAPFPLEWCVADRPTE